INIDWTNLVDKEGKLKDETSLRNLLKLNPNREIIVYCVSGTRASYAWFVLSEILRFNDVNVFDGSMIEWDYYKFVLEK
ncbi:MAG: hypothetical protein GOU98_01380, partial [Candidatus Altiarchaeota archaeon]|nr:hypothetical protein [Candidatus Altiarchaeota archaeon]